jgi:hypothetical protein
MRTGRKIRLILMVILCLGNIIQGYTQTKTDTLACFDKKLIIEYPAVNKINLVNYEEGYFKTINCIADTAAITIHCGAMVNLPLTSLTDKTIISKFTLGKDICIVRGYCLVQGRKKYFREENYFKYCITVVYENVNELRLSFYEHIFNNIKIQ